MRKGRPIKLWAVVDSAGRIDFYNLASRKTDLQYDPDKDAGEHIARVLLKEIRNARAPKPKRRKEIMCL